MELKLIGARTHKHGFNFNTKRFVTYLYNWQANNIKHSFYNKLFISYNHNNSNAYTSAYLLIRTNENSRLVIYELHKLKFLVTAKKDIEISALQFSHKHSPFSQTRKNERKFSHIHNSRTTASNIYCFFFILLKAPAIYRLKAVAGQFKTIKTSN